MAERLIAGEPLFSPEPEIPGLSTTQPSHLVLPRRRVKTKEDDRPLLAAREAVSQAGNFSGRRSNRMCSAVGFLGTERERIKIMMSLSSAVKQSFLFPFSYSTDAALVALSLCQIVSGRAWSFCFLAKTGMSFLCCCFFLPRYEIKRLQSRRGERVVRSKTCGRDRRKKNEVVYMFRTTPTSHSNPHHSPLTVDAGQCLVMMIPFSSFIARLLLMPMHENGTSSSSVRPLSTLCLPIFVISQFPRPLLPK